MIPSAFLRVFRPLDTFGEKERTMWERYVVAGGPPPPHPPLYRHEASPKEGPVGLLASDEGEEADIRLHEGRYFVCPWRTRLRVLTSIVSLKESAPSEVIDTFVPEGEMKRAARELARLRRRDPSAVPTILQSPWHVPIRWFILVDDEERRLEETDVGEYRLSYWTTLPKARKRIQRALPVLRRTDLAPLSHLVRELDQWLSSFHPECGLELDYGSVGSLFTWDELDDDHSARDVQEAVEALARPAGTARAAELYQQVAARWADPMSRESLN